MNPVEVIIYLTANEDNTYDAGRRAGLSEEALEDFAYALQDVKVTLLVNPTTGGYAIKSFEDNTVWGSPRDE